MVNKPTRQETNLALDHFEEDLKDLNWSFDADNYADYFAAMKEEQDYFRRAQQLSLYGVNIFIDAQKLAIDRKIYAAKLEVENRFTAAMEEASKRHRAEIEKYRQTYMKPIDFFKEKLVAHDWYYEYSDDIRVYRNGKAAEEALEKEAAAGGPEFVQAMADYRANLQAAERKQEERNRAGRARQDELRNGTPKAICDNWCLFDNEIGDLASDCKDSNGMRIAYGPQMEYNTTRIVFEDRWAKRFKTVSGSIYELGKPNPEFAKTHELLVRVLTNNY